MGAVKKKEGYHKLTKVIFLSVSLLSFFFVFHREALVFVESNQQIYDFYK